jgi:hypothetical protein
LDSGQPTFAATFRSIRSQRRSYRRICKGNILGDRWENLIRSLKHLASRAIAPSDRETATFSSIFDDVRVDVARRYIEDRGLPFS